MLAQEYSDHEEPPAESASPIDVPAFVPAEEERARLLQALESDYQDQLQNPHNYATQRATLVRRFQEFCKVLAKTVFEDLIFGHAVTEQAQQIFKIAEMLRSQAGWGGFKYHHSCQVGRTMALNFTEKAIQSYIDGMEKDFEWMETIFQSLDQQSKVKLLNLMSSLSAHQFAEREGCPITSDSESSQSITWKLMGLIDELSLSPGDAIEILKLAGKAGNVLNTLTLCVYRMFPPKDKDLTFEEILAKHAIKYLQKMYPDDFPADGPTRLYVNNSQVEIAALKFVASRFGLKSFEDYSTWGDLTRYWGCFREELSRVVDAAVSELRFRGKVVEKLGSGLSKGYIDDVIFLNDDLRAMSQWLSAVRRHCETHPELEECNELPGMIELYQQQRARFIEACGHASGLSQSFRSRGEDIMPKVEALVPDIRVGEEEGQPGSRVKSAHKTMGSEAPADPSKD